MPIMKKLLLSIAPRSKIFWKTKTTEKNWRDGLVNFFRVGVYKNLLEMILGIVYVKIIVWMS